jgi:hypothetical protein
MSQTQAQLVGNVVTGAVFAGIVTATSANIGGVVGINSDGINAIGVITATSFVGDGSGLTGVGVGTADNINTTGIITASTVSANEFVGSGDNLIFSPTITTFSPVDGATGVNALSSPDISITYGQPISLGVGTITLRKSSASGDVVESYEVGVSTRATLSTQTLTIDPTDNFDYNQEYYVVVPQGAVKNNIGGNSAALDTYNFTTEAGPTLSSASPSNGATGVSLGSNIVFTFNKNIRRGTGTITLRSGSASGTIIESFDAASSNRLTFSGSTLTIDPTSNLELNTNYYVVIPSGAVAGYAGIDTYDFTTVNQPTTLGSSYEGGYAICISGGTVWVVAPNTSEVSRNWYSRDDANTTAQQVSGCTGWFVPTRGQLQNPGYTCRTYWDSFSSAIYWSSTESDATGACRVNFVSGLAASYYKSTTFCVRAFRCVTY